MGKGFELEFAFVEKWGRLAKAEHLQIYIYALCAFKKTGAIMSASDIAKKMRISCDEVEDAIEFWCEVGVLMQENEGYAFPESGKVSTPKKAASAAERLRTRPSYNSAEIEATASVNKAVDNLFRQAEEILQKLLSPSDVEMIYSFVDWLGLPVEVVIMLLQFAARQGKTGKRYLETVAIDWADKGINTYESAEEYIRQIELRLSNEGKVRGILGIYDRALTQTEKKYIGMWVSEKNIPIPLIEEAYDRTVAATGKLSWAYMNKILTSWQNQGLENLDQVKEYETLFKMKNAPVRERSTPKKGINNYNDTNKPDYSNFAEEILKDMLGE